MENESVIITGNGLSIDTYNGEYQKVAIINENVNFQIDPSYSVNDSIFSKKFYPDFYQFIESNKSLDFLTVGEIFLENIYSNISTDPFGKTVWDNIVFFNSLCDYIYKLFWLYHKKTELVNTDNTGINIFSKYLKSFNKKPIFINLNYDLVLEKHLIKNGNSINYFGFQENSTIDSITIYKPHGSINFMSNQNDPNDNAFYNEDPFYPITNDDSIIEKNPLRFHNESVNPNRLGIIIDNEIPMYVIELVPPGCSNLIDKQYNTGSYLLPWAEKIYQNILLSLNNKKNMIIIGISFWDVDLWELIVYMRLFTEKNKESKIFILIYNDNENEKIKSKLIANKIDLAHIEIINGSFTDNYNHLIKVL